MAPYLAALLLIAADFAHPEADAAFVDASACGLKHPAYLSLAEVPEAERDRLCDSLRFFVPSLSASQALGDQLPVRVNPRLLRINLEALGPGWVNHWAEVSTRYAKDYRPDLKKPPLVVSGAWFLAIVSDPNQSGDLQYRLLYDTPPKTLAELEKFWAVNPEVQYQLGFLEEASGVKADDADGTRTIENRPTAKRGSWWITYDSKLAAGEKDPLENLLARPVKHDAAEVVIGIYKTYAGRSGLLQAYWLANAKGERQEKAPADIVEDHQRTRGVEIKNTVSCIGCHIEGLRLPNIDGFRDYILSGARVKTKDKADAREIDRYYAGFGKELSRGNEDYATAVGLCNGLTPEANARQFRAFVHAHDKPVTLATAACELFTTPEDLRLAIGDYSRRHSLSGRVAVLPTRAMSRSQFRDNFALLQTIVCEWGDQ